MDIGGHVEYCYLFTYLFRLANLTNKQKMNAKHTKTPSPAADQFSRIHRKTRSSSSPEPQEALQSFLYPPGNRKHSVRPVKCSAGVGGSAQTAAPSFPPKWNKIWTAFGGKDEERSGGENVLISGLTRSTPGCSVVRKTNNKQTVQINNNNNNKTAARGAHSF